MCTTKILCLHISSTNSFSVNLLIVPVLRVHWVQVIEHDEEERERVEPDCNMEESQCSVDDVKTFV